MIVEPRTSSPFSSAFFCFFLLYRGAHHFVAFSYASGLQAMALFGLDFERFPATIGALTFFIASVLQFFRMVSKLTRTPSDHAPYSFLSARFMLETPSTFSFSKLSYSIYTTSGNT